MATPTEIKPKSTPAQSGTKSGLRIQEFLFICLEHWWWFVISIVVCMACAFIYLKKTAPTYQKSASILIKTDSQGRTISTSASMFEDLGISAGNSSTIDEVQVIKSPDLMREVVRRLNLNMSYTTEGKFREINLYGSQLPIEVTMPDMEEEDYASFKLKLERNGDYTISDMNLRGQELNRAPIKGRIGTPSRLLSEPYR